MAMQRINEVINIIATATGAVAGFKAVQGSMQKTEQSTESLGNKLNSFFSQGSAKLNQFSQQVTGIGPRIISTFEGIINRVKGLIATISGINIVTGTALIGLGALNAFSLLHLSDQFLQLRKTWDDLKTSSFAPVLGVLANLMAYLNKLLKDPAVQQFAKNIALVAAVILEEVIPAIFGLISAIIALVNALGDAVASGDYSKIGGAIVDGFNKGSADAKAAITAAGKDDGATYNAAVAKEIRDGGGAAMAAAAADAAKQVAELAGKKADLGDFGTKLLNSMFADFKPEDFTALDQFTTTIKTKIDTLVNTSKFAKIDIIPTIIGSQTAIARALDDLNRTGSLSASTIARVRQDLAGLGTDVQDYAVDLLKATEAAKNLAAATKDLTAAQDGLKKSTDDLDKIQEKITANQDLLAIAEDKRTNDLKTLQPLQDQITKDTLDMADAVVRQDAALAALDPLIKKVAQDEDDLAKKHAELVKAEDALYDANQKLADSQQALADYNESVAASEKKLSDAVTAAQAVYTKDSEAISEAQRIRGEAIQDEQTKISDALDKQQKLLDKIDAENKDQLDKLNNILKAVDARWDHELKARTKALELATKLSNIENNKQTRSDLAFAQQRAAAQAIKGDNERIAALAKINRAQADYNKRNKDALDAANLTTKLAADRLQSTKDTVTLEKQSTQNQLDTLTTLIAGEKDIIQKRMDAINKEGAAKLKIMERENATLSRQEATRLRMDASQVKAAQTAYDLQMKTDNSQRDLLQKQIDADAKTVAKDQKTVATLSRQEEMLNRTATQDQASLTNATKIANLEVDTLAAKIKNESDIFEAKKAHINFTNDLEEKPIKDALEAAQQEANLAKSVSDWWALAAKTAQAPVDAWTKIVTDANKVTTDAETRFNWENKTAGELDAQRSLLQQIQAIWDNLAKQAAAAGGAGDPLGIGNAAGAGILSKLIGPMDQKAIDDMKKKMENFFTDVFGKIDWGKMGLALLKGITDWLKSNDALPYATLLIVALFTLLGTIMLGPAGALLGASLGLALANAIPNLEANFTTGLLGIVHLLDPNSKLGEEMRTVIFQDMLHIFDWFITGFDPAKADSLVAKTNLGLKLLTASFQGWVNAMDLLFNPAIVGSLPWMFNSFSKLIGNLFNPKISTSIPATIGRAFDPKQPNSIPGIIEGAAGSIFGALKKPFEDAWTWLFGASWFPELLQGIQKWFTDLPGEIGKLAGGVLDAITAPFKGAAKELGGFVGQGVAAAGTIMGDIWTGVTGTFKDIGTTLGGAVGGAAQGIGKFVGGAVQGGAGIVGGLVSNVGTALGNLGTGIGDKATGIMGNIWSGITTAWSDISDQVSGNDGSFVPKMISSIGGAFGGLLGTLVGQDGSAPESSNLGKTKKGVTSAWTSMHDAIVGADGAGGIMKTLADNLVAAMSVISKSIIGTEGTAKTPGTGFTGLLDQVYYLFLSYFATKDSDWGDKSIFQLLFAHGALKYGGKGFFAGIADELPAAFDVWKLKWGEQFDGLWTYLVGKISAVQDIHSDLFKAIIKLGEWIAAGVAQGMTDTTSSDALTKASKGMVDIADKKTSDASQSGSPAKRFYPHGEDITKGVAVGMVRALDAVAAAAMLTVLTISDVFAGGSIGNGGLNLSALAGISSMPSLPTSGLSTLQGAIFNPAQNTFQRSQDGHGAGNKTFTAGNVYIMPNPSQDPAEQEWYRTIAG